MSVMKRVFASVVLILSSGVVIAGDELDFEEARQLRAEGKIVAVEPLLEDAKRRHAGNLLEIELEHKHGGYVYEIELVDQDDRVLEFYYDAETGQFLKQEWDD